MTDMALVDAHMRTSYARGTSVGKLVARLGETVGYDADEFIEGAVDIVLAGQTDQAFASWSYLDDAAQSVDKFGRSIALDAPADYLIGSATHNGTPLETVYRRPARMLAELDDLGIDRAEALAKVSAEVELLASSDVAIAGRHAEQAYGATDKRVEGWNRVPNVGACDFCRLIATKDYNRRDLAPAHRSCHCGTRPRFRPMSEGADIVDREAYDRIEAKGQPTRRKQRAADSKAANKDLADGVQVADAVDDVASRGLPKGAEFAADDPYIAQLAEANGVTPDEVVAAKGRLKTVRQQIRDEAATVQQEAFDELYKWNDVKIKRPPRRAADRGGEYDWLEGLDQRERARLSRKWYSEDGLTVDNLADVVNGAGSDLGVDDAIDEWLRVNRQYEAAGAIRRGKLPSSRAYSGQIDADDLLPYATEDGYSVTTILGGDDLAGAAHIAGVEKELVAREAFQYLEKAATPTHGPSPYRMSFQAWEEEVRTLEYGLREFPGEMATNAKDRLRELVPELLDEGDDYEELYARIIDTAHRAGEELPDHAVIPWRL